jgi:hypothetical protein
VCVLHLVREIGAALAIKIWWDPNGYVLYNSLSTERSTCFLDSVYPRSGSLVRGHGRQSSRTDALACLRYIISIMFTSHTRKITVSLLERVWVTLCCISDDWRRKVYPPVRLCHGVRIYHETSQMPVTVSFNRTMVWHWGVTGVPVRRREHAILQVTDIIVAFPGVAVLSQGLKRFILFISIIPLIILLVS